MKIKTEIAIIGGGLAGFTMAAMLSSSGANITLIDAVDLSKSLTDEYDPRTTALSYFTRTLYEEIGIWDKIVANAGAINDILILDADYVQGDSKLTLHFDHKIVGDKAMGHIVQNSHLRKVLLDFLKKQKNIKLISNAKCKNFEADANHAKILLENGDEITAKLAIACDGKHSSLSKKLNLPCKFFDYKQTAIIAVIHHSEPHNNYAIERFLPNGPFAVLPLKNPNLSGIVWTEKTQTAPHFMALSEDEFMEELSKRFTDILGKLTLKGSVASYPLTLSYNEKYYDNRIAFIGDANHGIHPIAGQGFNLSAYDIKVLNDLVAEQKSLGLDIGAENLLHKYQEERRGGNYQMIFATDLLVKLFSNNITPIKLGRRIGIKAVDLFAPVKKFFIKNAMGL
jgi:2-octaprenyl-6-methoxyphenol hydroxylase